MADDAVRVSIGNDAQITKAFTEADVGDVAYPKLTWMGQVSDIPYQVGVLAVPMVAVGGVGPSPSVADEMTMIAQQSVQSIAPHLDVVLDQTVLQQHLQFGNSRSGKLLTDLSHQPQHHGIGHVLFLLLSYLLVVALTTTPEQLAVIPHAEVRVELPELFYRSGPDFFLMLIRSSCSAMSIIVSNAMFFI